MLLVPACVFIAIEVHIVVVAKDADNDEGYVPITLEVLVIMQGIEVAIVTPFVTVSRVIDKVIVVQPIKHSDRKNEQLIVN